MKTKEETSDTTMKRVTFVVVLFSLSLLLFVVYVAVIKEDSDFNEGRKDESCRMTWMSPSYVRVNSSLLASEKNASTSYRLYLYQEDDGSPKQRLSHLNGVPVLFLHGSGGSYQQIRSIGSVLSKMSEEREESVFDVFTIDFSEQSSALDGDLLWRQTEFANVCIDAIINRIYSKRDKEKRSVILIGHSMGGVVALGCISHERYIKDSVKTIMTLNTPHLRLPVMVDHRLVSFYHHVSAFWYDAHYSNQRESNYELVKDINVVSIAGGFKDKLIPATLSNIQDILIPSPHCISLVTTSIPLVRLHADHQNIVWCNQLVQVIAQGLYSIIESKTNERGARHHEIVHFEERVQRLWSIFQSPLPQIFSFNNNYSEPPFSPHRNTHRLSPTTKDDNDERDRVLVGCDSTSSALTLGSYLFINITLNDLYCFPVPLNRGILIAMTSVSYDNIHLSTPPKQPHYHVSFANMKNKYTLSSFIVIPIEYESNHRRETIAFEFSDDDDEDVSENNNRHFFAAQFLHPSQVINILPTPSLPFLSSEYLVEGGNREMAVRMSLQPIDKHIPLILSVHSTGECLGGDGGSLEWEEGILYGNIPKMNEEFALPFLHARASERHPSSFSSFSIKFHHNTDKVNLILFSDPHCSVLITIKWDVMGAIYYTVRMMYGMLVYLHYVTVFSLFVFLYRDFKSSREFKGIETILTLFFDDDQRPIKLTNQKRDSCLIVLLVLVLGWYPFLVPSSFWLFVSKAVFENTAIGREMEVLVEERIPGPIMGLCVLIVVVPALIVVYLLLYFISRLLFVCNYVRMIATETQVKVLVLSTAIVLCFFFHPYVLVVFFLFSMLCGISLTPATSELKSKNNFLKVLFMMHCAEVVVMLSEFISCIHEGCWWYPLSSPNFGSTISRLLSLDMYAVLCFSLSTHIFLALFSNGVPLALLSNISFYGWLGWIQVVSISLLYCDLVPFDPLTFFIVIDILLIVLGVISSSLPKIDPKVE